MKNYLDGLGEGWVLLEELERLDALTAGVVSPPAVGGEAITRRPGAGEPGELGRLEPEAAVWGAASRRSAPFTPLWAGAGRGTSLWELEEGTLSRAMGTPARREETAQGVEDRLRRDSRRYDGGFFLY